MLFDLSIPKQFVEADLFFQSALLFLNNAQAHVNRLFWSHDFWVLPALSPYQAAFQLPEVLLLTQWALLKAQPKPTTDNRMAPTDFCGLWIRPKAVEVHSGWSHIDLLFISVSSLKICLTRFSLLCSWFYAGLARYTEQTHQNISLALA